jgi:ATP-binding cassette subfamily B protein
LRPLGRLDAERLRGHRSTALGFGMSRQADTRYSSLRFADYVAKMWPFARPHRTHLAGIVALAALSSGLAAGEPLLLRQLFDSLLSPHASRATYCAFGGLGALLLSSELLSARLDRLTWKVRLGLDYALMQAGIERLHSLPLAYHSEHNVGATLTKIERGIAGSMAAFSDLTVRLLPALVYLTVSICVMVRLEWRLACAVLLFAPLPAWMGARAAVEQTAREQALMTRWTRLFARFNEVLTGIVVVKSFVMEEREQRRFLSGVSEANQLVLRGVETDATTHRNKNSLVVLARLFALGLGAVLVVRHAITLGTLIAFVSYLGGLFHPVQTLTSMYQTLRRASVSIDALLSIFDAADTLPDREHACEPSGLRGEVEFRAVEFRYKPERPVLDGLSFSIHAGEMVALVGPSGAGKSTLVTLLQRMYDPGAGAILIDGCDIRDFKQRSLRQNIGVVLQDAGLFSDSVGDNIAFGKPGASQQAIEAAARAAHAHDFITRLPQGYDTLVGERGCKLSGGERQRIAIARALLKDAPILVLDEATSALDAESEELVQQALQQLTRGRTTLVIAHRLSTITSADRIVVLRDGAIVEIGKHHELVANDQYYAGLVRKQQLGLSIHAA